MKIIKAVNLHVFLKAFLFIKKPAIKRNTIQLNGDNINESMAEATWCKV
jgi:hypothetical protein